MKKLLLSLAIATLLFACTNKEGKNEDSTLISDELAMQEMPVLEIGSFNESAGEFVNNEVKISGIVDHVCKHGGKKLLLVNDDGDVHVTSEERFPEELVGEQIMLTGIVVELRIDESTCMQMEEDNIKSHKEGKSDDDFFKNKKHSIQAYRDSMMAAGVDHLSYYSLEYVSLEKIADEALN